MRSGKMKHTVLWGLTLAALGSMTVFAEGVFDDYEVFHNEDGSIGISYDEVEITLPSDWEGKFGMEIKGDNVAFYQQASRDACEETGQDWGDGDLFWLSFSKNYDFTDYLPNYQILGSGKNGVYYLTEASDLRGYSLDKNILDEYTRMAGDFDWIYENSCMNDPEGEWGSISSFTFGSEYVIRDSSVRELTREELTGMDRDTLQMAINEIYARHGRRFVTPAIQEYFNSRDWYQGTVDAAAFDPSVLTDLEQRNIRLLLNVMESAPKGSLNIADIAPSGAAASNAGQSSQSIQIQQTEKEETWDEIRTFATGSKATTTGDVNIRQEGVSGSKIIAIAKTGVVVTVTGPNTNGWVPVSVQGVNGYIYQDYLK